MPEELKPCGTPAAARRHRRKGEPLCEVCEQAVRDEKNARKQAERVASAEAVSAAVSAAADVDDVDPLEEAMDNLRIVRAVLKSGEVPANAVATLTKRRDELVDRIRDLKNEQPSEVSVIDELTKRRRERVAAATG